MPPRLTAVFLALTVNAASAAPEPTYFLIDGNPAAVKYAAGRLQRLPAQDASELKDLNQLEAVAALSRAKQVRVMAGALPPRSATLSDAHVPQYGEAVFDVEVDGQATHGERLPVAWSGAVSFHEVRMDGRALKAPLLRTLIAKSKSAVTPTLDMRKYEPVARWLHLDDMPRVHQYGHPVGAPHLAFVDVNWHIKDLPDALANRGIDSWSEWIREEYVVDDRSGRVVYHASVRSGDVEPRDFRLFKADDGPLLMATILVCADGGEPLILDLEHESFGTGRPTDVPDLPHCFPAQ